MSTHLNDQKMLELENQIQHEVTTIKTKNDFNLPKKDDRIVSHFIKKLEGNYDVTRSKMDTDNVVDLLYISYNCTPQTEGKIRVEISSIMQRLIDVQQKSELTMRNALRISSNITKAILDYYPDWQDVKEDNDSKEFRTYFKSDFIDLAKDLSKKALIIKGELENIANEYDDLVNNTSKVCSLTENTLSINLNKKAEIEKEINEQKAKAAELEELVKGLQESIIKYDKMAIDFKNRAKDEESKAFISSMVKMGADLVSSIIPTVAISKALSGSIIAASAHQNTPSKKVKTKNSKGQNESQVKTEIAKLDTKKKKSVKKCENFEEIIADIKKKASEDSISEIEKNELLERIAKNENDLKEEQERLQNIEKNVQNLQDSLKEFSNSLKELSQEQRTQAGSLREMQMEMLNKVEEYEKEKSKQAAEMTKIKVLLQGKLNEEETIKLTIKSLNLSITALKRAKEIIIEIAFFFKSFVDFMSEVSDQSTVIVEDIERKFGLNNTDSDEEKKIRTNALKAVIENTDNFFITQMAEWHAVGIVSEKFINCFNEGWSKLNKLNGKYLLGDELRAYLDTAADLITKIVNERELASKNKLNDVEARRKELLELQNDQRN